jgi:hypothetical protein
MLRIPHCLDNRLTDGGKVVGSRHQSGLQKLQSRTVESNKSGYQSKPLLYSRSTRDNIQRYVAGNPVAQNLEVVVQIFNLLIGKSPSVCDVSLES